VNGGTKLQELPEIKNCVRRASRKSFFTHKDEKQTSQLKPLRLCVFTRVFFFSQSRKDLPAVDRLCVSTFFTHKGVKQSCQLKPLRLCALPAEGRREEKSHNLGGAAS
jgi:hypothetical protein